MLAGCPSPAPADDAAQFAIHFRSPTPYEVVEQDTLARIATRWGVSEDDLRRWNPDLDEPTPGQTLYVFVPAGTEPLALPPPEPEPAPRRPARRGGRCKAQRTDAAEGEIVTASGLSASQIQSAVSRRLGRTMRCLPADLHGEYEMIVEVTVGCDGRVTNTYTIGAGALPPAVTRCVEKVFRYTRFPAHDMPDGQSFQYPVTFSR